MHLHANNYLFLYYICIVLLIFYYHFSHGGGGVYVFVLFMCRTGVRLSTWLLVTVTWRWSSGWWRRARP